MHGSAIKSINRILSPWAGSMGRSMTSSAPCATIARGAEAAYAIGDPEIIRNVEINLGDCYRLAGDLGRHSSTWRRSIKTSSAVGRRVRSG